MAEEGTLAIITDIQYLAGAGANSTYTAEAYTNLYIKMCEGLVCGITRYDWVTNYALINSVGKELLRLATATMAATLAIQADMSGYSSGIEAESMINVLRDISIRASSLLRDQKRKDFMV